MVVVAKLFVRMLRVKTRNNNDTLVNLDHAESLSRVSKRDDVLTVIKMASGQILVAKEPSFDVIADEMGHHE